MILWSIPLGRAQTKVNIQDIVKVERVNADDFGLSEPILLPGNPFYFLKNWKWAIKRFFISNDLSKAEWSLDFLVSKVLEMRKLSEKDGVNEKRIEKSIGYYELINTKSEGLVSSVAQKDILNKMVKSAVFFKKAFNEIMDANFSIEIKSKVSALMAQKEKYFNDFFAGINASAEILQAFSQVTSQKEYGIFNSLRDLELIDDLIVVVPQEKGIITEFQDSLYAQSISVFINASFIFGDSFKEIIKTLPGDKVFQGQLLWDLEERSGYSELFEKIRGNINDSFLNDEQIKRCVGDLASVQKQISDFKDFIGSSKISANVESSLIMAEGSLKHAQERIAVGEEKYACNLIQSAKAKITNAERLINLTTKGNIEYRINQAEKKILDLRGLVQEYNQEEYQRLYDVVGQMDEQLLSIESSYQAMDFENALKKADNFDVLVSSLDYILDMINGNGVLMGELNIRKEFFNQTNLNRFSNLCSDKEGRLISDFVILPFCQLTNGGILSME